MILFAQGMKTSSLEGLEALGRFRCCEFQCSLVKVQSLVENDASGHDVHENDRDVHVSDRVEVHVNVPEPIIAPNTTAIPFQQATKAYPIVHLFESWLLDLLHFIFFNPNCLTIILLPLCSQPLFKSIIQDQPQTQPL